MKPICTILFLSILVACARAPDPVYPALEPLPCEPTGLIDLPQGTCTGIMNARATMTDTGCTCQNDAYTPVPNGNGYVCVYLDHVLSILERMHAELEELNLPPTEEVEDFYYPARPDTLLVMERHRMLRQEIERLHAQLLEQPFANTDESFRRVQHDLALFASQNRRTNCIRQFDLRSRNEIIQQHRAL